MKEKFALRGFLDSITGIEEKSSSTTSESNRDGNGGEDDDFGCKEKIKKNNKKKVPVQGVVCWTSVRDKSTRSRKVFVINKRKRKKKKSEIEKIAKKAQQYSKLRI